MRQQRWSRMSSITSPAIGVSASWSRAAQGPVRFTELEQSIRGISGRMLTLKLRRFERDGLLTRTVYPTVPPKVEYTLTDMAPGAARAGQSWLARADTSM
ncbi:winged helix-turn-helix transcriptional regulator [Nocardia sp. NPDC006982]|uniref:winged helix-turn-helix transcriptional regulator n=2 Tax=unclassified Nocardia TaxID=2637762 RepID=UPI0036A46647